MRTRYWYDRLGGHIGKLNAPSVLLNVASCCDACNTLGEPPLAELPKAQHPGPFD
ncbi:hypothetical protein [Pseudacidovorax sp. RU35E]|uniref:hypothetical protein n=1 Tax=Pseudacidovorax sp. RU35E TaxID=1907403 RepID=UPI001356615F|nr:hypothetical protein [Pseudacidovorax sp. RU35E]